VKSVPSARPAARAAPQDESALLEALRRGDPAASERWVRESTPRLLAVTRRLLGDDEEARDAVQEAFLSAFRALDGFQGGSRLSTWLHRIAVNAALMRLRTRRRRPEDPIEDLLPRFLEDGHFAAAPAPWRERGDALLERRELRARVRAAIEGLPEGHRNVLLLRDIEELDTGEVAEMLGLTVGAVKTRLHRARAALREALDPILREELA
jgi:RNA polymerase sigma-70 factor (ECF subfamily)